jgi:hypothetical protein
MVTGRLRVCWQRAALALSLLAGTAAMPVLTGATEVYRWVDSEGIVHFADRPPVGRSVEQIEIQPPVGALPLPNAEEILRRPVRPQDQSDQSEERPEAPEPEAEADEPEEYVRDRRSFRGR